MLSCCNYSRSAKNVTLFDDLNIVIETDYIEWTKRVELSQDGSVKLCSNVHEQPQTFTYYEVLFVHEPDCTFLIYHNLSLIDAKEVYQYCKSKLNELKRYFPGNKFVVSENLRLIMESLRINSNWTVTHLCARLGFDWYFTDNQSITTEMINAQVEPDMYTPLHLAVKNFLTPTIKLILSKSPNLNLVNSKQQSVLHYAAVSTQEIVVLILNQPKTFDRILMRDIKGCTALHMACYVQKFDIVFEFLKFGLTVRMLTLSPPNSRSISRTMSETKPSMNVVVTFTDEDFDDIDCQDIYTGGCPLHWAKHRRLMEKLITYSFPLNTRNANGDTPLHVVSKRLRLKCMLSLLCAGANVNANNIFGNTPLHHSVKENDLVVPQTLIVFDANINARNYNNESVRHVAAKACKSTGNEAILYLLTAIGAKRCPPTDEQNLCNLGCSYNGDFEGNICEKLFGVDQKYDRLYKEFLFSDIIEQKLKETSKKMGKENRVNLLCLDGGGIKGLVSIQILKEVARHLKNPINDYFKWYAGTSTGSFICAFLSMGYSLNQILSIYFRLKEKVLSGARPYSSDLLESLIQNEFGKDVKMEDLLTKYDKYVLIPSALANRRPMKLHLFRSFPSVQELFEASNDESLQEQLLPNHDKDLPNYKKYENINIEVWKACRASGAAPTYFRAYEDFLDGVMTSNNPTMDALSEFTHRNLALKSLKRFDECHELDLVLSVGTGKGLIEESDMVDIDSYGLRNIRQFRTLINLLVYEICQTEQHIVERSEAFCVVSKVPFFRLNSFLSDLMEIDEQQDYRIINCLWETKRFMYFRRKQVKVLVNYLENRTQNLPTRSNDKGNNKKSTILDLSSSIGTKCFQNKLKSDNK
ncbi:hypothetical protein RDWZM_006263 [Blomia tropicalis]|uniref:phospholipase A2 n=1 Tax=Blomia tropicalis TaxID=40697 RepID=A0A9Q0RP62_BLOTA|nr:hypothetical protein RDWZM_006263 [Blomia tropicalis]